MSKRKRSGEPTLQEKLEKHREDISRALKTAKGFERQRLSKRLREDGITPDKQERLEREVAVLKSLDLHQTARAHLYSSLLKVKSIAASTDLPDEIRTGVPKPELSENEKVALHNVTSGLYNRDPVKQSVDRAIATVCQTLNVPLPGKAKRVRKNKRDEKEEQAEDRIEDKPPIKEEKTVPSIEQAGAQVEDESEFEGFESDVDEPGRPVGEPEANEENEFSKYDHLLGSSSDSDSDDELDSSRLERFKGREKVNLDDISISGSDAGSEPDLDSEAEQSSASASPSPPPARKKKRRMEALPPGRPGDSTFLPSLMGGYISGSESASDIDAAPAKKRRGQRARQAIWEKKFGAKAKHLREQGAKGGRDAGWDMRRGAVEGEDAGPRTPWKKGVSNPLQRQARGGTDGGREETAPEPKKREKDDQGALHPSWEARKKAKESQKAASFAGAKIVFD